MSAFAAIRRYLTPPLNTIPAPDGRLFMNRKPPPPLPKKMTARFLCAAPKSFAQNAMRIWDMFLTMGRNRPDCVIASTPRRCNCVRTKANNGMRHWISFAPAAAFFGVYIFTRDFYAATAALIFSVILQIALLLAMRIPPTAAEWLAAVLIVVFGSVSLLLRETVYLQIKTTVVNWLFALSFPVADFIFKKNIARTLLGKLFDAQNAQWRLVSNALAFMFFFIGAVNLAAIRHLSEAEWVWTKTFVYPAINFIALIGVAIYLARRAAIRNDG